MTRPAAGRSRRRDDAVHVAFGAAVVTSLVLHAVLDARGRDVAETAASVAPVLAVGWSILRGPVRERGPWLVMLAGLAVLAVYNLDWVRQVHWTGAEVPSGPLALLGLPVGYLLILGASTHMLWRGHRRDGGALIDSALMALAVAIVLWAVLLGPALDEPGLEAARARAVVVLLLVSATTGIAIRALVGTTRRRTALAYLTAAIALTLVGNVVRALTTTTTDPAGPEWLGPMWTIAFYAVGAGALHPSVVDVTATHERAVQRRLTPLHLVGLGGVLALAPLVSGIQYLAGEPRDTVLLAMASLLIVPLVLGRIAQLASLYAAASDRLTHLATHDELTGLANRRALESRLAHVLTTLRTGGIPGIAVVFVDLDDVKKVNDTHGHRTGDALLRAVADRLRTTVRPEDLPVRFGGDEFVLLLTGDPATLSREIVPRVESVLAEPVVVDGVTFRSGASVGLVAVGPGDTRTAEQLISAADAEMYARKRVRKRERLTPTR